MTHLSRKRHFSAANKKEEPIVKRLVDVPQYFTRRGRERQRSAPSYDDVIASHRDQPIVASTPRRDWSPPPSTKVKPPSAPLTGNYRIPLKSSRRPAKSSSTVAPIRIKFPNPEALPPSKSKSKSKPAATHMDLSLNIDQAEAEAIIL
jgi:hypothetical protein